MNNNPDLFVTRVAYFRRSKILNQSIFQSSFNFFCSNDSARKKKKRKFNHAIIRYPKHTKRHAKMRPVTSRHYSNARQIVAVAKCTVATGRYRPDNIYVLRIQCAVSYQLIGEGKEPSRAKSGTETKRRWSGIFSLGGPGVRVTVAIALKPSVHTTRVRCMYDPAIQPPRAPLIYIGSDLPILCITRA